MNNQIDNLITYWKSQSIKIAEGKNQTEINSFEKNNQITIPLEFKQYLFYVNGMDFSYPNECDDNGFLFYPLERLELYERKSEKSSKDSILVFADYFQKNWWYGINVKSIDNETSVVLLSSLKEYNY